MRRAVLCFFALGLAASAFASQSITRLASAPAPVMVSEGRLSLPTYEEDLPDVNPRFDLFARRPFLIYPYTARTNLTDRRASRTWRTLVLENEHLKLVVLPDLEIGRAHV